MSSRRIERIDDLAHGLQTIVWVFGKKLHDHALHRDRKTRDVSPRRNRVEVDVSSENFARTF